MLELNAHSFLAAATELREIKVITRGLDKAGQLSDHDRQNVITPHAERLISELEKLNARSALASARRFLGRITDVDEAITFDYILQCLSDIESRFNDHLNDIKLIVLYENEASLFEPADDLLAVGGKPLTGFSSMYPNTSFEIEEATKCIALGRFTASVFHSMRSLEYGIKALSKFLSIPDPVKTSDKNWGKMLEAVSKSIDAKWPKNSRIAGSQGALIEGLYASLDAVKNPWRNATMHVENTYAPHEALHIARCVGDFMMRIMKLCDEEGLPPTSPEKAVHGLLESRPDDAPSVA